MSPIFFLLLSFYSSLFFFPIFHSSTSLQWKIHPNGTFIAHEQIWDVKHWNKIGFFSFSLFVFFSLSFLHFFISFLPSQILSFSTRKWKSSPSSPHYPLRGDLCPGDKVSNGESKVREKERERDDERVYPPFSTTCTHTHTYTGDTIFTNQKKSFEFVSFPSPLFFSPSHNPPSPPFSFPLSPLPPLPRAGNIMI